MICLAGNAQLNVIPLKEWAGNSNSPLVFYITGDGGFNDFSTDLCRNLNASGYAITALNSKAYFWDKKTPEGTAGDTRIYLEQQFAKRNDQRLVLIGYSFGADVIPFIVNRLPETLKKKLVSVILLSPSASTDFEVHWSDLLGSKRKRNMDVVAEINKMQVPKLVTLFGEKEDDFPVKQISAKNYVNENLPGGHHFGGNTKEVATTLMKYFR
jgi:type IV secretory pathway VirJ component